QNLCALQRSLSHFVGKDRFIADKHSESLASGIQWRSRRTSLKLSYFFGQPSGKGKYLRKRQIFTEGHEMHFVVASNPLAQRTDQGSRVENLRTLSAAVHCRRDSNRARHHPTSRLPRHRAHGISKQRIVRVKRRRRLGPHNQVIGHDKPVRGPRSEEHTSELQSLTNLV